METTAQKEGVTLGVIDGLLAATCVVYNLTLVTRNVSDGYFSGVHNTNPWDE